MNSGRGWALPATLLACLPAALPVGSAAQPIALRIAGADAIKVPETDAVVCALSRTPGPSKELRLITAEAAGPLLSRLEPDTLIKTICVHCNIPLQFTVADSTRPCSACGCSSSFVDCFVEDTPRNPTVESLLRALPGGTAFRVQFVDPKKPESGIKSLTVDRKTVLLALQQPAGQSEGELLALMRPFGATAVSLLQEGKLIQITLKQKWDAKSLARLEKSFKQSNILLASAAAGSEAR